MFKNNWLFKIGLTGGIALMAIARWNSPLLAQTNADNYPHNEKNGIYGDAPGGFNPLELMHRAQQSNGRSAEELDEEFQSQIDNSASDFKRLQQQKIIEQQQAQQSPAKTTQEKVESPETIEQN